MAEVNGEHDRLLEQITRKTEETLGLPLNPQALNYVTSTLKNIREERADIRGVLNTEKKKRFNLDEKKHKLAETIAGKEVNLKDPKEIAKIISKLSDEEMKVLEKALGG